MRLRGLLTGTGIPFRLYVGKTPEREAQVAGVWLPAGSSRADYHARVERAQCHRRDDYLPRKSCARGKRCERPAASRASCSPT